MCDRSVGVPSDGSEREMGAGGAICKGDACVHGGNPNPVRLLYTFHPAVRCACANIFGRQGYAALAPELPWVFRSPCPSNDVPGFPVEIPADRRASLRLIAARACQDGCTSWLSLGSLGPTVSGIHGVTPFGNDEVGDAVHHPLSFRCIGAGESGRLCGGDLECGCRGLVRCLELVLERADRWRRHRDRQWRQRDGRQFQRVLSRWRHAGRDRGSQHRRQVQPHRCAALRHRLAGRCRRGPVGRR